MREISVLVKEPYERPYWKTITQELETLQELVGGSIEVFSPTTDPSILAICNEEGKYTNLPFNFYLYDDAVMGTVFFCLADGESLGSFPEEKLSLLCESLLFDVPTNENSIC